MPTILTRYITKELIGWFCLWLVLLTMLLVIILVGQEAVRTNLGLGPILRLLPFVLPTSLAFAVPGTILFTVCLVYGRMSADNEVVATKALGISPLALLWPAYALAFALSLVGVWLNDLAYSWGQLGVQRVVIQSVEEIAYGMLRTQRSYANQRFSIVVKAVEGRRLIRPFMTFQPSNDLQSTLTISAAEAELRSDLTKNTMTLILDDFEIKTGDSVRGGFPGRKVLEYPLEFLSSRDSKLGSPAHLPLSQIAGETAAQRERISELEQSLAAEMALALVTGELNELRESVWKQRRNQLSTARVRLYRLQTEPWRRWAAGFSSLAFVMVGAPLAILLRKSDVMTTFGRVFLPILLIYYPVFMGCFDRAKVGALPACTVWSANLALAGIGLVLLRRVIRY
jgi:lipopolysaccharide export system permease protein